MRLYRSLAAFVAVLAGLVAVAERATAAGAVPGVRLETEITPVSARWIHRELGDAQRSGAALFVIQLDTPGGLDSSMRDIVRDVSRSRVTVAVWVGPSGARAASAGAYIAAAAHVVALAPGTNIGSATPVAGGGGGDLQDKVVNDAAAYIASLAQERGRNAAAYRRMVTDQANLTAAEAVRQGVADLLARSPAELLARLDGRPGADGRPLELDGAVARIEGMPWYLQVLDVIADPNLVFLFFSLGLAALGWEVFHPGAIVPGVVGALLLVTALFGLSILPFQWAGVAFILLAAGLFAAEVVTAGVGVLAAGGIASLIIGGLILFDEPGLEVSSPAVVGIALATGAATLLLVRTALRTRRLAVATGGSALIGAVGEVRAPIGPGGGQVFVNGELWAARTAGGETLPRGEPVRVVKIEELTLTVEPLRE
jgi:membrane-bound serine protease (ClpP class)